MGEKKQQVHLRLAAEVTKWVADYAKVHRITMAAACHQLVAQGCLCYQNGIGFDADSKPFYRAGITIGTVADLKSNSSEILQPGKSRVVWRDDPDEIFTEYDHTPVESNTNRVARAAIIKPPKPDDFDFSDLLQPDPPLKRK